MNVFTIKISDETKLLWNKRKSLKAQIRRLERRLKTLRNQKSPD